MTTGLNSTDSKRKSTPSLTGLDTSVLIAALVSSVSQHEDALKSLENLNDSLCTTPTNVGETLRILTHRRVFEKHLKLTKAVSHLSSFLDRYKVLILDEPTDWWQELTKIEVDIPGLKGNEIFDARIAFCLKRHGVKRIFTWDSDSKKYSFLKPIKSI